MSTISLFLSGMCLNNHNFDETLKNADIFKFHFILPNEHDELA